ncbi:hypothetical protein Anapl_06987 [Anas platyrhynchos]|uniref:Uncharacterized protein n=1 Tax=Anas platyrhynchos TaxID=8839 RepID=R0KF90_ANAPL|nr:hypothetical protein Anapl_06987 [Anas platyrhynchos]
MSGSSRTSYISEFRELGDKDDSTAGRAFTHTGHRPSVPQRGECNKFSDSTSVSHSPVTVGICSEVLRNIKVTVTAISLSQLPMLDIGLSLLVKHLDKHSEDFHVKEISKGYPEPLSYCCMVWVCSFPAGALGGIMPQPDAKIELRNNLKESEKRHVKPDMDFAIPFSIDLSLNFTYEQYQTIGYSK